MCSDTYTTIAAPSEGLYKEKGSRFLAFAYPITSEEEARNKIDLLKNSYHDARHHCFAYSLTSPKTISRYSDDGEPSGTAGKPISGQLMSTGITNAIVIVVRYFGGIKLGTSGLINAYRTATRDALEKATKVQQTIDQKLRVTFAFERQGEVMKLLKQTGLKPFDMCFDSQCALSVNIRMSLSEQITQQLFKIESTSITIIQER